MRYQWIVKGRANRCHARWPDNEIAELESLAWVQRHGSATDRRVREAVISRTGKAMTDLAVAARARVACAIFETWERHDTDELVPLMWKFADARVLQRSCPFSKFDTNR